MLLGVFTTATWEEMLFRYVGRTLFECNGKYSVSSVVLLSLAFGGSHLINLFFYAPISILLQVLRACTAGVFLLALYRHTGNLWVVILSHGFNNLIAMFFQMFPDSERFIQTWVLFVISVLAQLGIGIFILVKYDYVERNYPKDDF